MHTKYFGENVLRLQLMAIKKKSNNNNKQGDLDDAREITAV